MVLKHETCASVLRGFYKLSDRESENTADGSRFDGNGGQDYKVIVKVCIIDIGTNSIHVIYARIEPNGTYEIVGRDKEMVQLGQGTLVTGRLPDESMERTLEALERFKYLARSKGATEILVVATSAIREAENGKAFVKRVREELSLKVRIISGAEEARLIALAVQKSIQFPEKKALIVDIGGGSTEFILSTQNKKLWMESLPLGSNRLQQMFPLSDPPEESELESLEKHVKKVLKPVLEQLKGEDLKTFIGTSGTLNTLAKILMAERSESLVKVGYHQSAFRKADILEMYEVLASQTVEARKSVRGMNKKRVHMMVQGLAIVKVLLEHTTFKQFMPCDKALREGLLFNYIKKNKHEFEEIDAHGDLRMHSVLALLQKYDANLIHAEQTAKLATSLFDALKPHHDFDEDDRMLLECAALLHDVGYHINFTKHHRHSYYLIMNSDLDGFSPSQIEIIAWIARFHRKNFNKKKPEFQTLSESKQNQILTLSSILRVADGLDCSRFAVIDDFNIQVGNKSVKVAFEAKEDAKWEIFEALKRAEAFEKTFKRKLEFEHL